MLPSYKDEKTEAGFYVMFKGKETQTFVICTVYAWSTSLYKNTLQTPISFNNVIANLYGHQESYAQE